MRYLSHLLIAGLIVDCTEEKDRVYHGQPDPELGATSFVSAATSGLGRYEGPGVLAPSDDANDEDDARTIEEGDIFRVLPGGRVINLDAYRGLQVIDVADPMTPEVIGDLRISGTPVELYVIGQHALVLLNDWYGYFGSVGGTMSTFGKEQGGVVLLVDLADPTHPTIVDRVVVSGYLQKSRLATGTSPVLYVAAALWQVTDDVTTPVASSDRTLVRSFAVDLDDDALVPRGEIDLGGWVSDIQATPSALLVARTDWSASDASKVAVVDISDASGGLVLGADISVAGRVKNQFGLDLEGDVLRVFSEGGDPWSAHLETFDVADPNAPTPIDALAFGAGESLFATRFVGPDKAFGVTYLRQDPFHAFAIAGDGQLTEESAFVVSGWNDFFVPAFDDTRLVGVGIDDADQRRLAVSLYDITDLAAPEPLVARASADIASSWSEASWDHRAFSVLEDAVSVPAGADQATLETGLVLLPYSGWTGEGYVSGVRLFTFSASTLTARGALPDDLPVRRSFLSDDDTAACLSDVALSLHDVSDPDAPTALGSVELAPSYATFDVFGDYGVRVVDAGARAWWSTTHGPPPDRAEVIALDDDPDHAKPLASFELDAGSTLTKVGDLAVSLAASWVDGASPGWQTRVTVWDLADPLAPARRGELATFDLPPSYRGYAWDTATPRPAPSADSIACLGCYDYAPRGTVVGDTIAFLESTYMSAPVGSQERCVTTPPVVGETPEHPAVTYYSGRIECVRSGDGPETCSGGIYACAGFDVECTLVSDPTTIGATTTCADEVVTRYWTRYTVHVLDVSAPAEPVVRAPITLPEAEEGVSLLADGDTLWVTTREPYTKSGDPRSYVRYYVRAIDLGDASHPQIGARINVPGVLVAVRGDDLYTVDAVYADDHVDAAVARVELTSDDVARLAARKRYDARDVQALVLDDAGHALVSHAPASWWYGYGVATADAVGSATDWDVVLDVLDDQTLVARGAVSLDAWAQLRTAVEGRAVFQVPGGMLVVDVRDASSPEPRAWLATAGWIQELRVVGARLFVAAGLYGLYAFDLDAFALLPPATP